MNVVGMLSEPVMGVRERSWEREQDGWVKIVSLMDSGCADSVTPPSTVPFIAPQESEGSRRGQEYQVANGDPLPNLGEKLVEGYDELGGGPEDSVPVGRCDSAIEQRL